MKRQLNPRPILYYLSLFLSIVYLQSCNNHEKGHRESIFKMESTKEEPTIDFYIIDCLNEVNQKNIKLSNIAFQSTTDVKTLQLLLKIKINHKDIDNELNKLTKKNLIIIPQLIHYSNIKTDSIKSKDATVHLLKELETQIETQISLFDRIQKTSQNEDFETFAMKSKKTLETNRDELKNTLVYLK